jgi:hypothetical protein
VPPTRIPTTPPPGTDTHHYTTRILVPLKRH